MNKVGMSTETLVRLIVALIVLGLLFAIYTDFAFFANDQAEIESCRLSVGAATLTSTSFTESLSSLKCPVTTKTSEAKTSEEVHLELATEMYTCWYKFGNGELDFYSNWEFGASKNHCLVCSKIYFDEKPKTTFGNFAYYLNNKEIPGNDETFTEFFTGVEHGRMMIGDDDVSQNDFMNFEEPVYVVYRVNKYNEDNQMIASLAGLGVEEGVNIEGVPYEGVPEGLAYQTGYSAIVGGVPVEGAFSLGGETLIVQKEFVKSSGATKYAVHKLTDTGTGRVFAKGYSKYGSASEATAAIVTKGGKAMPAGALRTALRSVAKGTGKLAVGIASKFVGKKVAGLGAKAIPYVGWAWAIFDVGKSVLWANDLYPSIAVYSVAEIGDQCESFS